MHNSAENMNGSTTAMTVLMFPWLAHGHISPFLQLAKQLARNNLYIYFCSTSANLNSIKTKISPKDALSIELIELHLPSLPDLPPQYHTTNGLPLHLMPTLKKAFDMSTSHFSTILKTIKPHLLIYDFLQPWAPAIASKYNIPAVEFLTTGAAICSYMTHALDKPGVPFPYQEIFIQDYEQSRFTSMKEATTNGLSDEERVKQCAVLSCRIILVKTFREIEGKYIDYLSILLNGKKMVPVGPLVDDDDDELSDDIIMEWLDTKEKGSVVFVSFGSEYYLSLDEIEEIALGLEISRVNFIWVIRFEKGGKIKMHEALPKGFITRVKERGLVVEGWAPQMKILEHDSVGGFVSHCGWSSVMEGMKAGIPIIAMPMHLDQPFNARVITSIGVGVEVKKRHELENSSHGVLDRNEIAKVVRDVMFGNSDDVRSRAREFSRKMTENADDSRDIEEAVNQLLHLSHSYQRQISFNNGVHNNNNNNNNSNTTIDL